MASRHQVQSHSPAFNDSEPDLQEVVMGLHWDPPSIGVTNQAADLDALCVLFDSHARVLEVVHPGHPRSVDGSVVHTGDSRTGASSWDDERIFVFLEALPEEVSELAFIVSSASGQAFNEVPGAYCHISDHVSEAAWTRIDLTSLFGHTACTVAILRRAEAGWKIATDAHAVEDRLLAELRRLVGGAK